MKVKGHHPLAEGIAKKLIGVESVPEKYAGRMVQSAIDFAVQWHKEKVRDLQIEIEQLRKWKSAYKDLHTLHADGHLDKSYELHKEKEEYEERIGLALALSEGYDGFNTVDGLKSLVDDMARMLRGKVEFVKTDGTVVKILEEP